MVVVRMTAPLLAAILLAAVPARPPTALGAGLAPETGATAGGAFPLQVIPSNAQPSDLLAGRGWDGVSETLLNMNRTPPIYEGDPVDDGYRPRASVALVRAGDSFLIRLRWTDPTDSDPRGPERFPDAGDDHIYKAHSRDLERFADAACVMVPRDAGPRDAYPAVMMGDAGDPVLLYYWHRVKGLEVLQAAGRASVTGTGDTFPGRIRRTAEGWEVTLEIPAVPEGTPMAFAVWDGDRGQRSGLKYYSLWYEVTP